MRTESLEVTKQIMSPRPTHEIDPANLKLEFGQIEKTENCYKLNIDVTPKDGTIVKLLKEDSVTSTPSAKESSSLSTNGTLPVTSKNTSPVKSTKKASVTAKNRTSTRSSKRTSVTKKKALTSRKRSSVMSDDDTSLTMRDSSPELAPIRSVKAKIITHISRQDKTPVMSEYCLEGNSSTVIKRIDEFAVMKNYLRSSDRLKENHVLITVQDMDSHGNVIKTDVMESSEIVLPSNNS